MFAYASSAPTITGNLAVATGVGASHETQLAVVDLSTMEADKLVSSTPEGPLPQDGFTTPALLVKQGSDVYAYFTVYTDKQADPHAQSYKTGSNVYVYKLGDDTAKLLWASAQAGANTSPLALINDPEGNLYHLDTSGFLVKLSASRPPDSRPSDPTNPSKPTPKPTDPVKPDVSPTDPIEPKSTYPQAEDAFPGTRTQLNKPRDMVSLLHNAAIKAQPAPIEQQEDSATSIQDLLADAAPSDAEDADKQVLFVPVSDFPITPAVALGAVGVVTLSALAWFVFAKP